MSALPDGYVAIPGRSHEKALKLLAAADKVGVDQTLIRSFPFSDEYHVPEAVGVYFNEHSDEDLTEDEIADVRAPRPYVPLIENKSTPEVANTDGLSGSDGTALGNSETGDELEDGENGTENPVPAKSASKGDWLDYAVSVEEGKFEASEETPTFDREAVRKQLDDDNTKDVLVSTYGA